MMIWSTVVCLSALCVIAVLADINMHNPRGSNNRLNKRGRNVDGQTRQRLFDSQNNDRSGYNEGSVPNEEHDVDMVYYSNSKLTFEWANQHEANSENTDKSNRKTHAKVIIQYMARNDIRNGEISKKSPDQDKNCKSTNNCDTDKQYGKHESFESYKHCSARDRHPDLTTEYDDVQGPTARYTRQNPAGKRYGFECPEERDFYPYPLPTEWKDIAVLTEDAEDCENNIAAKSQNSEEKGICVPTEAYMKKLRTLSDNTIRNLIKKNRLPSIAVTEQECTETVYEGENFTWKTVAKHGLPSPVCGDLPTTRINHNGFTVEGNFGRHEVDLSTAIHQDDLNKNLVFRMRYFIDSGDVLNKEGLLNYTGLGFEEGGDAPEERGYVFENNPQVNIFPGLDSPLQLAINTAQVGRTFEDRSHTVKVIPPPEDLANDAVIHNVNVVGKRGNIVQVYPAVEYRFMPDILTVCEGDYIHFQWTGSNTNPKNNAGNGPKGTDRSNVIIMKPSYFKTFHCEKEAESGCASTNVPNEIGKTFAGISVPDKWAMAVDALESPYFNKLVQATTSGTYYYLCTRNNDFSNRSHKGKLIVKPQADCASSPTKKRASVKDIEKRFHAHVMDFASENMNR